MKPEINFDSVDEIRKYIKEIENNLKEIESKGFQDEDLRKVRKNLLNELKLLKEKEEKIINKTRKHQRKSQEVEGCIYLKNGCRTGRSLNFRIFEELKTEQDHTLNIQLVKFNGRIEIKNESLSDPLYDIELKLNNIQKTNLESDRINVEKLGTDENNNLYYKEFQILNHFQKFLIAKEYLNNLPDADCVLNKKDVDIALESKIYNKSESSTVKDNNIFELENYDSLYYKNNVLTIDLVMKNVYSNPINNIKVIKEIPSEFENSKFFDVNMGDAKIQNNRLIWNINSLPSNKLTFCKFTSNIGLNKIEGKNSGRIEISYEVIPNYADSISIEETNIKTNYKCFIDIKEQNQEDIWNYVIIYENTSEFIIAIEKIEIYTDKNELLKSNYFELHEQPWLPAGAQWRSNLWQYVSKKKPELKVYSKIKVIPDIKSQLNGKIIISDIKFKLGKYDF